MSSNGFDFNKAAAGILLPLVVVLSASLVINGYFGIEKKLVHDEVDQTTVAAAVEQVTISDAELLVLISAGDAINGKKLSKKCSSCHTFTPGGKNRVGPGLHGSFGADIANRDDYDYSNAMADLGGDWDELKLNGFLTKPKTWLPSTKMNFVGLKKQKQRSDIIAYIKSLK